MKRTTVAALLDTKAFLIMVHSMITDTETNLINCSAICFDNLVDSQSRADMAWTTKQHLDKTEGVSIRTRELIMSTN